MIRATALVVVLVVASMVAAAPAASKELRKARLCGSSDCVRVNLGLAARIGPDGLWSDEPAAPSPYYRLELYFGGQHRADLYWVPAMSKVAGSSDRGMTWQDAGQAANRLLREASKGLRPLPVPRIDTARLGSHELPGDANRYLGVFRDTQGVGTLKGERVELDFYSAQRSPWTDGPVDYYPDANSLRFGLSLVRISDQEAALLEGDDTGFPSRVILVLLASTLAAVATAGTLRTRAHRARAKESAASGLVQPTTTSEH